MIDNALHEPKESALAPLARGAAPLTLPTAMSRSPRMAAMIEVAISGSDVPTVTTVSPTTSTVGLRGAEGEVLRRTLPACGIYALLGGALALLLAG